MPKQTFKQVLISKVQKRIEILEIRLAKYAIIKRELDDCKATLAIMSDSPHEEEHIVIPRTEVAGSLNTNAFGIFMQLSSQFQPGDLAALLNNDRSTAFNWIASWKQNQWIETVSRGVYRKLNPKFVAGANE